MLSPENSVVAVVATSAHRLLSWPVLLKNAESTSAVIEISGLFFKLKNLILMEKRAKTDYPIHPILEQRWSPRAFDEKPVEKEKLQRLFEAARWSPSSSNEQPWYFMVGRSGDNTYAKIFDTLIEFNQLWAKTAPILVLAVGYSKSLKSGRDHFWYKYDVGQAVAHLSFQATEEGLYVHQMAGFDRAKASELFSLSDGHNALTVFAIGYMGDYKVLHPNLQPLELAERSRKSLKEFVFSNNFGEVSALI
jgi:nitroreductase